MIVFVVAGTHARYTTSNPVFTESAPAGRFFGWFADFLKKFFAYMTGFAFDFCGNPVS